MNKTLNVYTHDAKHTILWDKIANSYLKLDS